MTVCRNAAPKISFERKQLKNNSELTIRRPHKEDEEPQISRMIDNNCDLLVLHQLSFGTEPIAETLTQSSQYPHGEHDMTAGERILPAPPQDAAHDPQHGEYGNLGSFLIEPGENEGGSYEGGTEVPCGR